MSQNSQTQEAQIAVEVTGALIIDRLFPTIMNAIDFGAERHPEDNTFSAWCNGALYGIASTFGARRGRHA